jgi:TrmH family RNA methyltransferase
VRYIASDANAAVKRARKLLRKKGRDTNDAFLIEGFILIEEALSAGVEIERVFLRGDDDETARALYAVPGFPGEGPGVGSDEGAGSGENPGPGVGSDEGAGSGENPGLGVGSGPGAGGIRVDALAEEIFDSIADTVTPRGVIAVAKIPSAPEGPRGDALLVLDRLQDPGNVGALMRTAYAMGFDGTLCVKGTSDPFSPKAVRASAGALFRLPVYDADSPAQAVDSLRAGGHRIILLDAGGASPCWDADLTGRVAMVVGNEGAGADEVFVRAADAIVRAPMTEGADSLNAAVAAGMAMYERCRQTDMRVGG